MYSFNNDKAKYGKNKQRKNRGCLCYIKQKLFN